MVLCALMSASIVATGNSLRHSLHPNDSESHWHESCDRRVTFTILNYPAVNQ
jgi:hypothetical protein